MRSIPRFLFPAKQKHIERVWFAKGYDAFARYQETNFRMLAQPMWEEERAELVTLARRTLVGKSVTDDSFKQLKDSLRSKFIEYRQKWYDRFRGLVSNTTTLVGSSVSGELGVAFSVNSEHVQKVINQRTRLLADRVSKSSYHALTHSLRVGMKQGENVEQLAARISAVYTRGYRGGKTHVLPTPARAKVFAQTESTAIVNGAALAAVQASGKAYVKVWVTMGDSKVRPEHVSLEGETRPLNRLFSNGVQYPCEPNCRCSLRFQTKE